MGSLLYTLFSTSLRLAVARAAVPKNVRLLEHLPPCPFYQSGRFVWEP